MDPVKLKFALAVCLSLGLVAAEPVFAQSSSTSAELSAAVDGVRGRCGLGLLARTTSAQTCQSFKDYGARMQCVADDLTDEGRAKGAPVLVEVASCYRALGDALVAGRGANNDQVNALEDFCRNLRHETVVPRSPGARDALLLASDALMPGFSRKTVAVPTNNPMMGIRLHDLQECAVALSIPSGPPTAAGTPGPNRVSRAGNGVSTSAVQSPRFAYLTAPGIDSPPTPQAAPPVSQSLPSPSAVLVAPAVASSEERQVVEKLAEGPVDRTVGQSKGRNTIVDLRASAPISESAVISALPAVAVSNRKASRRPTSKAERSPAGYGVTAADRGRPTSRAASGSGAGSEASPIARSSNSNASSAGYSASSPPSLPLMGPPLRPQTSSSVR